MGGLNSDFHSLWERTSYVWHSTYTIVQWVFPSPLSFLSLCFLYFLLLVLFHNKTQYQEISRKKPNEGISHMNDKHLKITKGTHAEKWYTIKVLLEFVVTSIYYYILFVILSICEWMDAVDDDDDEQNNWMNEWEYIHYTYMSWNECVMLYSYYDWWWKHETRIGIWFKPVPYYIMIQEQRINVFIRKHFISMGLFI